MRKNKGALLYQKAKKIIPGGTQLLSKRPEMFLPDAWPSYYSRCKGIKVWDLEDIEYYDFSISGVGTCPLGYADNDVDTAVIKAVRAGNMCTLNVPEEVELAELLCKIHPWAQMVRFARSGGEAMAMAVRIARAKTKRDKVLFCGYHGWHDWYLSSNLADDKSLDGYLLPGLSPIGVPRNLKGLTFPFRFNDVNNLLKIVKNNSGDIAAIILETIRNEPPERNFIDTIQEISRKYKTVFIVDEITCGWRLNIGGAHMLYDIKPDIAVFAKAISNGYPMAAVIGRTDVMQAAQKTFISSTFWTDRIGPVAALATIQKMKKRNTPLYLQTIGKIIQEGWKSIAKEEGIEISVSGIYPLSHFSFNYLNPLELKTLYTQLMLKQKFLASTVFYATSAHTETDVEKYLTATRYAFKAISKAINKNCVLRLLEGPVCHEGFTRLN